MKWNNQGFSVNEIVRHLSSEYVSISKRTLERRVHEWGVRKQTRVNGEYKAFLRGRISTIFFQYSYDDQTIQKELKEDGCDIYIKVVRKLRKELEITLRRSGEAWAE